MTVTLGVVLAGGRGSRLDPGRPKALVPLAGRTLLERALACAGAACDEVVVTAPSGLDLGVPPARRVADVPGAAGPLAGLVAGLESRPFDRAIVLGVDFPLMTPALLATLLARLGQARALRPAHAVVPLPSGVPQPLAAAYAPPAAELLRARLDAGERSVVAALRGLVVEWVTAAELERLPGGAEAFLNVNVPGDLERARGIIETRTARGQS